MTDLPLDFLRAIALREISKDGSTPLFVTVSGSHLYGFSSPDSDFDLRGAHVMPLPRALSLFPSKETLERSGIEEGREIDFVSHEAGKFFRLMLKKNGYVMEQVLSPLVVAGGPELDELREIARGCITRHIHHHYRGFSENEIAQFGKQEEKKAKTLLYVYRVLLTGIHVLRTGEIEPNLRRLLDLHPQPGVSELIALKVREKAALDPKEAGRHLLAIEALRGELEEAFASSKLPEEPARGRDLDDFLRRLRLRR